MHLTYNNVNDAFEGLVRGFAEETFPITRKPSRVGEVLQIDEPVIVTFKNPRQRVLLNEERDANPFFHLFESLWMLSGRNDVAPLSYYASGIGDIASDDGRTFNGAYGKRWRDAYTGGDSIAEDNYVDQLSWLIEHLRKTPTSRRAVLQMWNVQDDLLKVDITKDVCCNTAVYFSLTNGRLDMTVTNRSNDLIWGMLGANVVHFSMLQEYVANCLGVQVGVYNQFTNNLHVYTERFEPEKWLSWEPTLSYEKSVGESTQLVTTDQKTFDREVAKFVDRNWCSNGVSDFDNETYSNSFLGQTAKPMTNAFHLHKGREYEEAQRHLRSISSGDWRVAATNWINKRERDWRAKNDKS